MIARLVTHMLGTKAGIGALETVTVDPALLAEQGETVSRAAFAMAMNVVLFHGLLDRVPSGRAYVDEIRARGGRVTFDHGALRTIRFAYGPTGSLPPGEDAFTRILRPLGYDMAAVYPLDRLRMTGRAYRHADAPAVIPQFFLSELHVDRFDAEFEAAAHRVFDASADPLDDAALALLATFATDGQAPFDRAAASLRAIVSAFDRQHPLPAFEDYQLLLSRSNEAAWIATEGNAFNHATDRVANVAALADRLRADGRPVKDKLEISMSGRVRQTAFRADSVEREFAGRRLKTVPGSFFEFISRDIDPATGAIDLAFDTGNATGIFAMTQASKAIANSKVD
ncbi:DUF1338 family protein [Sphingobium sp. AN641]|uniref:2-oxoadipate dioxygenase/decarboxylase family protein n=1 Tax=Sphingobium sp. AN641 TaxID=3133443 RepID=UPI0030C3A032